MECDIVLCFVIENAYVQIYGVQLNRKVHIFIDANTLHLQQEFEHKVFVNTHRTTSEQ